MRIAEIGVVLFTHAQENQGILVHAQDIPNPGDRFSNVLQNYSEGNSPGTPQWISASGVSNGFRCPAYKTTQKWKTGFGIYQYLNAYIVSGDYSETNQTSWYGRFRLISFPAPSRTMIVDSTKDHVVSAKRSTGFNLANSDPTRHGNNANYLFLDGHAESLTEAEALKIIP